MPRSLPRTAKTPRWRSSTGPLGSACAHLGEATQWIREAAARDPEETGAASYDYLRLMGLTALGHMWARSARVALDQVIGDNSGFYEAKLATARFYMKRLLPMTESLKLTLSAGADALMGDGRRGVLGRLKT